MDVWTSVLLWTLAIGSIVAAFFSVAISMLRRYCLLPRRFMPLSAQTEVTIPMSAANLTTDLVDGGDGERAMSGNRRAIVVHRQPAPRPDDDAEERSLRYVPLLNPPWVDRCRMTTALEAKLLSFPTFAEAKAQALAWAVKRVREIEELEEPPA